MTSNKDSGLARIEEFGRDTLDRWLDRYRIRAMHEGNGPWSKSALDTPVCTISLLPASQCSACFFPQRH